MKSERWMWRAAKRRATALVGALCVLLISSPAFAGNSGRSGGALTSALNTLADYARGDIANAVGVLGMIAIIGTAILNRDRSPDAIKHGIFLSMALVALIKAPVIVDWAINSAGALV